MSPLFDTDGQECAQLAMAFAWENHALGPVSEWPQVLITTLNILLNSRHPLCLFWGEENHYFYNDGYIPILGTAKHPWAMGRPGAEVWAEVWPLLLPQISQVKGEGRATWMVDHMVPILRQGRSESSYFTYSYSPVFSDEGTVEGTFVTCSETTGRIHAEAALRERESNLALALESARMAIWHLDFRTGLATGSGEIDGIYGLGDNPVIPIEVGIRLVHPDDADTVEREWRACVVERRPYIQEFRIVRRDGEIRWVHSRGTARYTDVGEPIGITALVLDLTDTRKSENALRESEARFEQICEALPHLVWTAHPDGRCGYLNRQWRDYTGRSKSADPGLRWLADAFPPEDREAALARWKHASKGNSPFDIEHRLVRADGASRWFRTRGTPIADARGQVTHWFGTCTDIDNVKSAQIRYERDVDTSPAILWITDPEGLCTYLSQQWYAHTGQRPGEGLGVGWLEATHPEDFKRAGEAFFDANKRRAPFRVEYRLRNADGDYRWAIDAGNPRFDPSGAYLGMAGTVLDIHERIEAEVELEAALRARDEFLSIASHELKTPLTSLKLQAQLHARSVRKGDPEAYSQVRVDDLVAQTEKQVIRLNRLVDDMLDVARIRTGRLSLQVEAIDFGALVEETVSRFAEQFRSAGYEHPTVSRSGNCTGAWDSARLEQVVANLLTNAIRYGERKDVTLNVVGSLECVTLAVTDRGIGISDEAKEKIFDRFERAINANEVSGLGLGLFISREIVAAQGGSIRVESALGQGATFIVELPRVGTCMVPAGS